VHMSCFWRAYSRVLCRSVAQQRLARGSVFAAGPPPKRMASVSMASALSRSASAVAVSEASATSASPLLPQVSTAAAWSLCMPPRVRLQGVRAVTKMVRMAMCRHIL
jgi:hypothetical protein